jgi:hypothetical protein
VVPFAYYLAIIHANTTRVIAFEQVISLLIYFVIDKDERDTFGFSHDVWLGAVPHHSIVWWVMLSPLRMSLVLEVFLPLSCLLFVYDV